MPAARRRDRGQSQPDRPGAGQSGGQCHQIHARRAARCASAHRGHRAGRGSVGGRQRSRHSRRPTGHGWWSALCGWRPAAIRRAPGLGLSLVAAVAHFHNAELVLEDNDADGPARPILRFPRTAIRALPAAPLKSAASSFAQRAIARLSAMLRRFRVDSAHAVRSRPRRAAWKRRWRARLCAAGCRGAAAGWRCSATVPIWAGWRCARPGALAEYFARRPGDGAERPRSCWRMRRSAPRAKPRRWRTCASPSAAPRWPSRWPTLPAPGTSNQVTAALTRFADACVGAALRFLLRQAAARDGHPERDGAVLEEITGLTVLAMGKYGAFELNYSSDIDLVVFYDARQISLRQARRSARRGGRYRARPGQADGRDHRRRLCLSRRSAPAARCRRHPDRHLHRCGAGLLRSDGPELGARRHDQGARLRRRSRRPARRSWPASRPSSGGAIWISRRSRTSIPSSARSTPMPAMARSRWRATTSSWGAAASARSNSSPRPSN